MKLFKRLTAAALAVSMTLSAAAFQGITAYADSSAPTTYGGWYETAYATWPETSSNWTGTNSSTGLASSSAEVKYKLSTESSYTTADSALIRLLDDNSTGRVDIPGLAAGTYDLLITSSSGTTYEATGITVYEEDRSGYAHFNRSTSEDAYDGVGAYNDDGTPKDNAAVIYVTEENKNTVTLTAGSTTYTGIGNIAAKIQTISQTLNTPIIIRFIGEVDTSVWTKDDTQKNIYRDTSTYSTINNLVNKIYYCTLSSDTAYTYYNDYTLSSADSDDVTTSESGTSGYGDTYFNMLDFKHTGSSDNQTNQTCFSNLTVEGIGTDAEIVNFGFLFRYCNSVEVKNLTFTSYEEDACAFQDSNRVWLHRCNFNVGKNLCDLSSDQDKSDGDGSSDMNACKNATTSYCVYNQTHKTFLNGNGASTQQWNYTYHHNYYYQCKARLPLVRYANIHTYNNYVYGTTDTSISARASAFVYSEYNYYVSNKTVFESTNESSKGYGLIKSYNDTFSSNTTVGTGTSYIMAAESRESTFDGISSNDSSNQHLSSDTYINNFDVDSDNFYYSNGASDVSNLLTDSSTIATEATTYSGVLKDSTTYIDIMSDGYTIIESDQTLDYTNYSTTVYFQGTNTISYDTTKNPTYLRFTTDTSVSFKVAEGATITINAKNPSTDSGDTRTLTLTSSSDSSNPITKSYTVTSGNDYDGGTVYVSSSAEDIYTLTADNNMNIRTITVTFGDSDETTETTTEAGVIYDKATLTFEIEETSTEVTTDTVFDDDGYFTLLADSSNTMTIEANSKKPVSGQLEYTYRLKSTNATTCDSSTGVPTARAIMFKTGDSAVVQIYGAAAGASNPSTRNLKIYKADDYTNAVEPTIAYTSTTPSFSELITLSGAGTYYITFDSGINLYSVNVVVGSVTTGSDGNGYVITDTTDSYIVTGITSDDFSAKSSLTVTVTADGYESGADAETDTVYEQAIIDGLLITPSYLGTDYSYLYVVKIEDSGGASDFSCSTELT